VTGLPPRIALATHNPHKLRELARICTDWPTELVSVENHEAAAFPDVDETGATYLDNARLKAEAVAAASGLPALADDSGIEVDALGGAPGPRSARYAGEHASDDENLRALIQAIRGVPASGRSARYRCVAAMAWPDGRFEHAEGVCEGTLRTSPAGTGGFGYDPVFVPVGWDVTMAELTDEQKDRISHRGRAFRAVRELLDGS
jgi:XTP/dITP diphosphohydrolase